MRAGVWVFLWVLTVWPYLRAQRDGDARSRGRWLWLSGERRRADGPERSRLSVLGFLQSGPQLVAHRYIHLAAVPISPALGVLCHRRGEPVNWRRTTRKPASGSSRSAEDP